MSFRNYLRSYNNDTRKTNFHWYIKIADYYRLIGFKTLFQRANVKKKMVYINWVAMLFFIFASDVHLMHAFVLFFGLTFRYSRAGKTRL